LPDRTGLSVQVLRPHREDLVDDVVRRSVFFASLDDETAETLFSRLEVLHRRRGDVIFRQDDPAQELWLIADGRVKLARTTADQRETVIAVVGPGEVFGETCLLEGTPRAATATAICETTLIVVKIADVDLIIATHPDVVPQLMQVLARRLRNANELLSELAFRDVPGRVARALVELGGRFGERTCDGLLVAHGLTQEELAQLVGASREAVNKALSDFAARGWLRLQLRAVYLLNLQRLQRRAHLHPTAPPTVVSPRAPGHGALGTAGGLGVRPPG
jgi:CRP/FNR family cyclic AMP-dependent transcriptional regulator